MTLQGCDECGRPWLLLTPTVRGRLGPCCYFRLGRPAVEALSMLATHESELATRERMTARGGTDRHLVRNGRT